MIDGKEVNTMGDFGEPGGVTERLEKLAHGGEDLNQMYTETALFQALLEKSEVDPQVLEKKIVSIMDELGVDRKRALNFLLQI